MGKRRFRMTRVEQSVADSPPTAIHYGMTFGASPVLSQQEWELITSATESACTTEGTPPNPPSVVSENESDSA